MRYNGSWPCQQERKYEEITVDRREQSTKEIAGNIRTLYVFFFSHSIHNIPQKIQFSCPVLAC